MSHTVKGEPYIASETVEFTVQRKGNKVIIPPLPNGAILSDKAGDALGRYLVFTNTDEPEKEPTVADDKPDNTTKPSGGPEDNKGTDQIKAYDTPEAAPGAGA